MAITPQDVEHLAKLARLELTGEEVARFTHELGDVLGYVAKLRELKEKPGAGVDVAPVELRPDEVWPWPNPAELIAGSPRVSQNLIEVPGVFGERE